MYKEITIHREQTQLPTKHTSNQKNRNRKNPKTFPQLNGRGDEINRSLNGEEA